MHPQLNLAIAEQRIADLHRAADHDHLVRTATSAASCPAVPAACDATAAPVMLIRRLRRRLAHTHAAAR